MENMLEIALRTKLRFPTPSRGEISLEQLWNDVPLRSRNDFNLNAVAQEALVLVRESSVESFVDTVTAANKAATLRLDIVKHVIKVKLAEEAKRETFAANTIKRKRLMQILAEKQAGALMELSEAELKQQIAALA
jgi:hypothetical protein